MDILPPIDILPPTPIDILPPIYILTLIDNSYPSVSDPFNSDTDPNPDPRILFRK